MEAVSSDAMDVLAAESAVSSVGCLSGVKASRKRVVGVGRMGGSNETPLVNGAVTMEAKEDEREEDEDVDGLDVVPGCSVSDGCSSGGGTSARPSSTVGMCELWDDCC